MGARAYVLLLGAHSADCLTRRSDLSNVPRPAGRPQLFTAPAHSHGHHYIFGLALILSSYIFNLSITIIIISFYWKTYNILQANKII